MHPRRSSLPLPEKATVAPIAGAPIVGARWFVRLFLFVALVSFATSPLALIIPNSAPGLRFATTILAGIGFLGAAAFARVDDSRSAVVLGAATLLGSSILNATFGEFDAEAVGITVVAAVLVLPATSRRRIAPTLVAIGLAGMVAVAVSRFASERAVSELTGTEIGSFLSALSVLAIALALVGWVHIRLVDALERARLARRDLDASEARFRTLVETAPEGMLVLDPATLQATAANQRAAEILGYETSADLVATAPATLMQGLQPDGRSTLEIYREVADATLDGRPVVRELLCRRRDGARITVEIRSSLVLVAGDTEIRLSVSDVSERAAAVRARDATEARFRSLFVSSPNAVLVIDSTGRIVEASDRAQDVFGYTADQLRALSVEDLVPPGDRERHRAHRAKFSTNLERRHLGVGRELNAIRADRQPFPVEIGLSSFDTDEGRFTTAVIVDLSARREAERAALEATETIRGVFDASPAGIMVTALDGTVRLWNSAMAKLTGIAVADAIGRVDPAVPDDRLSGRAEIRVRVAGNETLTGVDLSLVHADRSIVPAVGSFGPLHDAAGSVIGIVAVVEDVTAMRSLEAQVNRKARLEAIGQLAGGIAHDINNVLTAIGGFASLSLDDLDAGVPVDREAIATIAEGAARTGELTRQLLAFARRDIRPAETLGLGEQVRIVEPMLRGLIGEHIALTVLTSDQGHVRIAGSQVEQLVINLVVNARDAMPNGGTIRVEVANLVVDGDAVGGHLDVAAGPYIALTVTDDGTGMPPEVAERVFDPFFTTKGPDEGTGLGLATVHGIVTAAGGNVWVYSEPGVGTTFRIVLPQTDALASEPRSAPDVPLGGDETILFVEDEELVRVLGTRVLERAGFTVLAASNAEEAFAHSSAHDGPIDLLVADVIMPRIQGPQLAAELVRLRPGLPVVFTSGYTAGGAGLTAALPPDARFLDKPFSPNGLIAAVRAAIDDRDVPIAS